MTEEAGRFSTRAEIAALRARGAQVFLLKSARDQEGLTRLRHRLWQSDTHVILLWLYPDEMAALYPILRDRKNFSAVLDDWWIIPHWFIREAEYKITRKYNGIAVRRGLTGFVEKPPPLFSRPEPCTAYPLVSAALRLPALAVSPVVDFYKRWQKKLEDFQPAKWLYFPFPIASDSVPLVEEKIRFDFSFTGSTFGVWLMRDAYAPFKYTFANLYDDRQHLLDRVVQFDGDPFKVYDWRRREHPRRPPATWQNYIQINRQSRFAISSGGLHAAAVPKYLEYACLGTPMIGSKLPFEYPWLEDCLIPLDSRQLSRAQLKQALHEAIEKYPALRANCLRWRERLLELHDIHRLLDMVQAQADGQPIPPGYLKAEAATTTLEDNPNQ